jgi:protein transport protein SEC61 subunit gamma-like protein|tara:strand:+ start:90 stop:278 length:189 start_codon:yes stop_codon:yes gene_type:complete
MNFASWGFKLKSFAGECKRVLKVTKKPDRTEFKTIVKVSGLGIIIIGMIGFIITMLKLLIFP